MSTVEYVTVAACALVGLCVLAMLFVYVLNAVTDAFETLSD